MNTRLSQLPIIPDPTFLTDAQIDRIAQSSCVAMLPPEDGSGFGMDDGIFRPAIWGNRGKFWPNRSQLRVRFLNGDRRQKDQVWARIQQIDEWTGLSFKRVASGPSEIRIAFNRGSGHWSYVGRDNLGIPQHYQTMNIDLAARGESKEYDRVVIHEMFHALGFNHEHQHPIDKVAWNKPAVYEVYGRTQGWSRSEIDRQVLDPGSSRGFVGTGLDTKSIMMYPIPLELVLDKKFASGWNSKPSESDLTLIASVYP